MSRRYGPPWGGGHPPWWPENETWPPEGRAAWRPMGRQFMRRLVGCAVLGVIGFGVLQSIVAVVIARIAGVAEPPHLLAFAFAPLLFILFALAIAFTFGRWFRGAAAPVGEIVDGLGRVAAGEQSVRVGVRGTRTVRRVAAAFNTMAERLERSDAQRRALLADVSHELRTPLTVIQGQLEGIVDGVYPSDAEHLAPLMEQTRILSRLIDDLRTLSHAEAGALALHRQPTDVRVHVERAVASFRADAERAGVTLATEVAADAGTVELDAVRIGEVLANLVGNALRYTPRDGRVTVVASRDGGALAIEVRDTGAGIAADALPHVFDRFYKSGESRGSGLGLAIAKGLVVAHGGEITATSGGVGQGTTVRFTIPTVSPA